MSGRASVLIIDGDAVGRAAVTAGLHRDGHRVTQAGDAAAGLKHLEIRPFDLVILDPDLPDRSGFALVRAIRTHSDCGLILLAARTGRQDRLLGLDSGADDYLVKPVDLPELLARARAVLRRCGSVRPAEDGLVRVFAGWHLDLLRRELTDAEGRLVKLTRAEFDLIAALAQAQGRTLTRDYLIEVVSDAESDAQVRTVDAMVSRIRRKLAASGIRTAPGIVTVHGVGYRFIAPTPTR